MTRHPLRGALNVVRDLWRLTIVDQIKDGLLRPHGWPEGLAVIVALSASAYAVLTATVVLAGPLRGQSPLVSASNAVTLPSATVPLLLIGLLLSLSLLHTAALHAAWYLRIAALVIGLLAIAEFAVSATETLGMVAAVGAGLGLLGLTLGRIGHRFAWWEFVVTTALFGVGILTPIAVQSLSGSMGYEWRPGLLEKGITTLSVLAFPTIMAAGAALAQISVSVAESGATASARELPRGPFLVVLGVVVVWRLVDIAGLLSPSSSQVSLVSCGTTLVLAAVAAGLMAWMWRLSQRRRLPVAADLVERWSGLMYPVAIGCTWLLVLLLPFSLVRAIGGALHNDVLFGIGDAVLWLASAPWQAIAFRGAIGLICLAVGIRLARRGELVGPLVLVAFCANTLVDVVGLVPGLNAFGTDTVQTSALLATVAALGIGVWHLARGGLTLQSAVAILAVLLLCAVYPHRGILDNPISAALGFSGLGAVLFGLIWNVLTQGDVTHEDTRALPRTTRVLGFCASSLFAVTALAFVVLSRSSGEVIDITPYGELGDTFLGTPLFHTAVLVGLRVAVARRGEVV